MSRADLSSRQQYTAHAAYCESKTESRLASQARHPFGFPGRNFHFAKSGRVTDLRCLRLRPRFGRALARRQLGGFEHAALIVRVFNPLFQSFAQPFERGLMLRHV